VPHDPIIKNSNKSMEKNGGRDIEKFQFEQNDIGGQCEG